MAWTWRSAWGFEEFPVNSWPIWITHGALKNCIFGLCRQTCSIITISSEQMQAQWFICLFISYPFHKDHGNNDSESDIFYPLDTTPLLFLFYQHFVFQNGTLKRSQFSSTSHNPFHYSHSKDFPLFSEPQIISPLLQKATPLLGFKTKGQGQAGGREGGGRGQKEKKGDTQRRRAREKRGMGQAGRGGMRQKNAEKGVSQSRSVYLVFVCFGGLIMMRAWDGTTDLLYPSDRLETQISIFTHHLCLIICCLSLIFVFPFKVIDVISFWNPA